MLTSQLKLPPDFFKHASVAPSCREDTEHSDGCTFSRAVPHPLAQAKLQRSWPRLPLSKSLMHTVGSISISKDGWLLFSWWAGWFTVFCQNVLVFDLSLFGEAELSGLVSLSSAPALYNKPHFRRPMGIEISPAAEWYWPETYEVCFAYCVSCRHNSLNYPRHGGVTKWCFCLRGLILLLASTAGETSKACGMFLISLVPLHLAFSFPFLSGLCWATPRFLGPISRLKHIDLHNHGIYDHHNSS